MLPAPIPDNQAESRVSAVERRRSHASARRRLHRHSFAVLYADPRIVDEIGGKIYRYSPALRLILVLGLSLVAWLGLFFASSALLSYL